MKNSYSEKNYRLHKCQSPWIVCGSGIDGQLWRVGVSTCSLKAGWALGHWWQAQGEASSEISLLALPIRPQGKLPSLKGFHNMTFPS